MGLFQQPQPITLKIPRVTKTVPARLPELIDPAASKSPVSRLPKAVLESQSGCSVSESPDLRRQSNLAPTKILKEDRSEGATGKVVILAEVESAMSVRKSVRHGNDRIVEFLGTLLSSMTSVSTEIEELRSFNTHLSLRIVKS